MAETDPLVEKSRSCFPACWSEPCCEDSALEKVREPWWDNWRGLLQLNVVAMHCLGIGMLLSLDAHGAVIGFVESVPGSAVWGLIHFLCAFTMPAFCFITGFFSTASPGRSQLVNQVRYSLTWFVQHSIMFGLVAHHTYVMRHNRWRADHPDLDRTNNYREANGLDPLEAPGILPLIYFLVLGVDWYLWCVVIWRFVLPVLAMLQRPLLLSFILSIFVMLTDASTNTYANAPFCFLPYFVAGVQFKEFVKERSDEFVALRRSVAGRALVLTALLGCIALAAWDGIKLMVLVQHPMICLYGGQISYDKIRSEAELRKLLSENITARILREDAADPVLAPPATYCQTSYGVFSVLAFYAVSFCLIFASMSCVPEQHTPILTRAGARSIYIYFMHMFFSWPMSILAVLLCINGHSLSPWLSAPLVLAFCVGVWAALAQQWAKCLCKPCIEPDVECCLVRTKEPMCPS